MGSNNQEIDASVGGLVWVRRRNGSWWPGRILGLDELPAKCLIPPRSGTPIKLLGREDGSVDWYNLEKSKRVKAFRCGEYDECIERAKNSVVHFNKKSANAGRYVRREDAILHALELEKACSFVENQKFSSARNNSMGTTDKDLAPQSNMFGHSKEPVYVARTLSRLENSTQELSQSVLSFEHPDKPTASEMDYMQRKRRRTPNDSEDDATEGIKRMRDLQDLGMGLASKRKSNVFVQTKGSHDLAFPDSASLSESNINNGFSSVSRINSSKDSCSSLKRRRSQLVQVYENLKRKSRNRPLTKFWVGETKVKIPPFCHRGAIARQSSLQGFTKIKVRALKTTSKKTDFTSVIDDSLDCSSTSSEEALSDTHEDTCNAAIGGTHCHSEMMDSEHSSMLEFIDNDCSDGFINVPVVMGGKNAADLSRTYGSSPSTKFNSHAEEFQSNHRIQVGLVSPLNEGLGESGSTGSASQVNYVRQKIDLGASEWYSKGKRNLRCLSLSRNADSESFVDRADQFDTCLVNRTQKEIVNSTSDESLTSDNSGQLIKCRSISEVGTVPGDQTPKLYAVNQDFAGENGCAYPAGTVNVCNSIRHAREKGASLARDVLVSTMPPRLSLPHRQIRLPSKYRDMETSSSIHSHQLYDVELNVHASYQGHRVPLVSLMSKLNGKAIVGHPITVEVLGNGPSPTSRSIDQLLKNRGNMIGKLQPKGEHAALQEKKSGSPMVRSSLSNRKSSGVKKSGFLPRKIRRLSSFSIDHKEKEDGRKSMVEKLGSPAVSCIPLRLVFSRLNEALSSSSRPAN